jgi:hypothetical protein
MRLEWVTRNGIPINDSRWTVLPNGSLSITSVSARTLVMIPDNVFLNNSGGILGNLS